MRGLRGKSIDEIYDLYHGCHYNDRNSVLTLREDLGGQSFDMVWTDAKAISQVPQGSFRLLYQHRNMNGAMELPDQISVQDIPEDLAVSIMKIGDAVGSLNVYTPDLDDAKRVMTSADIDYGSSIGSMGTITSDISMLRNTKIKGYGNMCFFGKVLTESDQQYLVRTGSDLCLGFHVISEHTIQFSSALGGEVIERDFDCKAVISNAEAGSFYLLYDLKPYEKMMPGNTSAFLSKQPISRDIALKILRDPNISMTSIFTLMRDDALRLMKEASDDGKYHETRNGKGLISFQGRCLLKNRKAIDSPKVVYTTK